MKLLERLAEFVETNKFTTIGALNVGLIMSRRARDDGLPLDPEKQLAASGAQVRGLNGAAGNAILKDHGIKHRMGTESGRTNRGSTPQMRTYVAFLNSLSDQSDFDIAEIERFWIEQIVAFYENKPFHIRREAGATVQAIIHDLLEQAQERQKKSGGAMVVGTMLQHLVGAKLEAALTGRVSVSHHGANTSDQKGRGGDFDLGDAAIHVTASPGELLIGRCRANIDSGLRPIIVTTAKSSAVAAGLAEQHGLSARIEVHSAEQFIALNIIELGKFSTTGIAQSLKDVIDRYNKIIDTYETNPSLKIEWS